MYIHLTYYSQCLFEIGAISTNSQIKIWGLGRLSNLSKFIHLLNGRTDKQTPEVN